MGKSNIIPFPETVRRMGRAQENVKIKDFATEYDNFICGASPTEEYENYIHDVARHFFSRGYSLGLEDSRISRAAKDIT